MTTTDLREIGTRAIERARRWSIEANDFPVEYSAKLLSEVLKDPDGLDFTVRFVDGVVRPEDTSVAARNLAKLGSSRVNFLPWYLGAGMKAGGLATRVLPAVAVPAARRVFRAMVGDLVVDATDSTLGPALAKIRAAGNKINVNLLGEAVLGDAEAKKRLDLNRKLLARDDVDYISLKVSAVTGPHNPWGFDEVVAHAMEQLLPFYREAAAASSAKFINLDMEDYKDLELTLTVFMRLLDDPALKNYRAGIVIQAYQPDGLGAMIRLQEWAARRVAEGGSPIKVRLVKGANLAMERVDSEVHDWPLTTWPSKQDSDTNYKRVLNWALTPERTANISIGVAGQNLFDIAFAWELAQARGVTDGVEFEMLAGMATGQAEVVRKEVGSLLLYVPVVNPSEFDVAIAYLVRRLEENAMSDNFMSGVFDIGTNDAIFVRERDRFLAALENLDDSVPVPNRTQDRGATGPAAPRAASPQVFVNTPDTDPVLPANRAWAKQIIGRIADSQLGIELADASIVNSIKGIDEAVQRAVGAAEGWAAMPAAERAEILHRVGAELEARRADLLEVAASETGKTLDQGDPEVSEAIDFAHYYAFQSLELEKVDGARFVPSKLTVVTPPWNFPLAIPAGGVLAALASGSSVILKPATPARRCGALLAEIMWDAGVPRDVLQLVNTPKRNVGQRLVSHPKVDRLILTGSYETSKLFRSWRTDLPMLAETSGKNAIIVTPSADPDLAVKDIIYSAFGHAGQKCSAASLVVLVGSAGTSKRIHNQLVDGVRSLRVAWPSDPSSQMGPVVVPGDTKLQSGLTTLDPGQTWVLKPEQLDDSGALWSPGLRAGVEPGSEYHLTEYFGPILGVMRAETLEEAIEIVNAVDYGLTSGIHSLDIDEVQTWLSTIQAGNLYVNRVTTGAIVQRQPFGGWKRSAVGAGTKAGGPSYLFGLGNWEPAESTAKAPAGIGSLPLSVRMLAQAAQRVLDGDQLAWYMQALGSDMAAWESEFGVSHDPTGLSVERNVLRYRPTPVVVRAEAGASLAELLRVVSAGLLAGSHMIISSGIELSAGILEELNLPELSVLDQTDAEWLEFAANWAGHDVIGGRVRYIGTAPKNTSDAVGGSPDIAIWSHAVTQAGRVELIPFLREQAVSITAHRFGTPFKDFINAEI
ncbi:L-proline dehydrogenase [Ruaniaceae bacterium KH17]|nr:L-proline dehydrogenase [Ruaniaceae bacterium KH17]